MAGQKVDEKVHLMVVLLVESTVVKKDLRSVAQSVASMAFLTVVSRADLTAA